MAEEMRAYDNNNETTGISNENFRPSKDIFGPFFFVRTSRPKLFHDFLILFAKFNKLVNPGCSDMSISIIDG